MIVSRKVVFVHFQVVKVPIDENEGDGISLRISAFVLKRIKRKGVSVDLCRSNLDCDLVQHVYRT